MTAIVFSRVLEKYVYKSDWIVNSNYTLLSKVLGRLPLHTWGHILKEVTPTYMEMRGVSVKMRRRNYAP